MVLQRTGQKLLLRIHHDIQVPAVQEFEHLLVHRGRQHIRYMAREDQVVLVDQAAQPCIQDSDVLIRDLGALPVDRGFRVRDDLHVDTAHALLDIDEIVLYTDPVKEALDLRAREPRDESQGGVLIAEVFESDGDIDSFSTRIHVLRGGPVDNTRVEVINTDDIVKAWTESNCIDHSILLLPAVADHWIIFCFSSQTL